MCLQQQGVVSALAGQSQQILAELVRGGEGTSCPIKKPQAPKSGEQARRLPKLPAQRPRPRVRCLHLRRPPAQGRHVYTPQPNSQDDFPLGTLRADGLAFEECERMCEVHARLLVRAAAPRVLSRVLAITRRTLQVAALLEMHRKFGGDVGSPFSVSGLLARPDLSMQLRSTASGKALIQHVTVQRMEELEPGGNRSVGPLGGSGLAKELVLSGQRRQRRFHL